MSLVHSIDLESVVCPHCGGSVKFADLAMIAVEREVIRLGEALPAAQVVPPGVWYAWGHGGCWSDNHNVFVGCRFRGWVFEAVEEVIGEYARVPEEFAPLLALYGPAWVPVDSGD